MLEVADLERASAFYRDVLGLRLVGPWPGESAPSLGLQTDEGDFVVIVQPDVLTPPWPGTCTYFEFAPEQWQEVQARLRAARTPILVDPKGGIRGAGELRVRVLDPDGHALELHAFEPQFYDVPAARRGKVVAGGVEDFPVGSVTRVPEGRCYLVRAPAGFMAISEVCTHRQFTVSYQPEHFRFACPLHGNRYSPTGRLTHKGSREDTLPLHVYRIEFVDGQVVVDTDESIPRTREEPDRFALPTGSPP